MPDIIIDNAPPDYKRALTIGDASDNFDKSVNTEKEASIAKDTYCDGASERNCTEFVKFLKDNGYPTIGQIDPNHILPMRVDNFHSFWLNINLNLFEQKYGQKVLEITRFNDPCFWHRPKTTLKYNFENGRVVSGKKGLSTVSLDPPVEFKGPAFANRYVQALYTLYKYVDEIVIVEGQQHLDEQEHKARYHSVLKLRNYLKQQLADLLAKFEKPTEKNGVVKLPISFVYPWEGAQARIENGYAVFTGGHPFSWRGITIPFYGMDISQYKKLSFELYQIPNNTLRSKCKKIANRLWDAPSDSCEGERIKVEVYDSEDWRTDPAVDTIETENGRYSLDIDMKNLEKIQVLLADTNTSTVRVGNFSLEK